MARKYTYRKRKSATTIAKEIAQKDARTKHMHKFVDDITDEFSDEGYDDTITFPGVETKYKKEYKTKYKKEYKTRSTIVSDFDEKTEDIIHLQETYDEKKLSIIVDNFDVMRVTNLRK